MDEKKLKELILEGKSYEEISAMLKVPILDIIFKAKELELDVIKNAIMEQTLYKRAKGYYAVEETIVENDDGSKQKRTTKKPILPNEKSLELWLTNRASGRWRVTPSDSENVENGLNRIAEALEKTYLEEDDATDS